MSEDLRLDPSAASHDELREAVREHYDILTPAYSLLWGEHVHHGYWDGPASPQTAQERMIRELATYAGIPRGGRVADIGCGIGGSSRWLIRHLGCRTVGLSISGNQLREAHRRGPAKGASWVCGDALRLPLATDAFDAAWIVECSEHLLDRETLFREIARVVRPGGPLALAVWLRTEAADPALLRRVEAAFLTAPLHTPEQCRSTLENAGWRAVEWRDVTRPTLPTWEHCIRATESPLIRSALRFQPEAVRQFVKGFPDILRAYREGSMAYGLFRAIR